MKTPQNNELFDLKGYNIPEKIQMNERRCQKKIST